MTTPRRARWCGGLMAIGLLAAGGCDGEPAADAPEAAAAKPAPAAEDRQDPAETDDPKAPKPDPAPASAPKLPEGLQLPRVANGGPLEAPADIYVSMRQIVRGDEVLVALLDGEPDPTAMKGHLIGPLNDALAPLIERGKKAAAAAGTEWHGRIVLAADARLPFSTLIDVLYTSGRAGYLRFDFVVAAPDGSQRVVSIVPPRFDPHGPPPPPRLKALVVADGLQLRSAGEELANLARTSSGALDLDALTKHATAFHAEHPDGEGVVTAEVTIPTGEVIAAIAGLRGPDCAYPEPDDCLLAEILIEAGAV